MLPGGPPPLWQTAVTLHPWFPTRAVLNAVGADVCVGGGSAMATEPAHPSVYLIVRLKKEIKMVKHNPRFCPRRAVHQFDQSGDLGES